MVMIIALALTTAVQAQVAAIHALADQDTRVATIGYRIARGGAGTEEQGLCAGKVSLPGLVLQDIAQYASRQRVAARAALNLADGPTVVAIVGGSTAAAAGFQLGDRIVGVDGTVIDAPIASDNYARVQQAESLIAQRMMTGDVMVTVRRAGASIDLRYAPERGCPSQVQIITGRGLNALADGNYVQITAATVDFAANDDDLAVVVAHEIAHNILRHQARKTPSRQAEYEADRLGVWLVARAGYMVDAVVPFWTRLGKRTGLGIFSDGSHPRWTSRVAAVTAAVAELKAQQAAHLPLSPVPLVPR